MFQQTVAAGFFSFMAAWAWAAPAPAVAPFQEPDVSWTAEEKLEHLWRQSEETRYGALPTKGPSTADSVRALRPSFLHRTFLHRGEILPEGRRKVVHPFGVLGRIRFIVTEPTQYTGIFRTGAVGLVRMSLASLDTANFAPGAAFKFLVDGRESVNMVATYGLDGQGGNQDFFANQFSTILPKPRIRWTQPRTWARSAAIQVGSLAFWIAGKTMPRAISSPFVLPLDEMAAMDRHGNTIGNFVKPHEVILVRSACVRGLISEDSEGPFQNDLSRVQPGEVYEVYARSEPHETPSKIGVIVLEGRFEASRFGDEGIFFRHQRPLE